MSVTSLRIPDKYDQVIKDYLATTGDSFSGFAVEAMIEKIEDNIDIKSYEKAISDDKNKPTISHEEMKAELGL